MTSRSRKARPRWVPPPIRETVREPKATILDRSPPLVILGGMLLLSALGHVVLVNAIRGVRAARIPERPADAVQVTVIEKPVTPLEAPVDPVVPVVARRRPNPWVPRSALPTAVPPPPTPEVQSPAPADAVPDQAPALLPGISLSATTVAGQMKVGRGGSPAGRPAGESAGGGTGKVYKAQEFVEAYALTEEPEFLDNVSPAQLSRFYPEAEKKEKIEGAVKAKLLVDSDGSVVRVVTVTDPGHGFAAAASKVARLYRFKPGRVNGKAVATEILFTIRFEIVE